MATKKRSPTLTKVPNEIAARYRDGQEKRACEALALLGTVQTYPRQRMIVLERSASQTTAKVRSALDDLQAARVIEFVTPVLLDRESNTRQVLTDEIVLRLKPGRSERTLDALTAAHGLKICSRNEFEPSQYIVKVPKASGTATLDVARTLDQSDDVEFASPNFLTRLKR